MLLAAAVIAGTANAFAPPASTRATSRLYEDAAVAEVEVPEEPAVPEVVEELFCRGYVGGEGPEPIPFAGIKQTSVNWDPLDFAGVSSVCFKPSLELNINSGQLSENNIENKCAACHNT